MTGEEANLIIQAFYEAIVARERDETAALNIGLHQLTIQQCGRDLYINLVNKEELIQHEKDNSTTDGRMG